MNTMYKLMKKKNNKGFSLVELIVVVLIIGILAVAIAPQVTEWVGKARTSQTTNESANLISAAQVAAAEMEQDTMNFKGTYKIDTDGKATAQGSADNDFAAKLTEILEGSKISTGRAIEISGSSITVR